MTKQELLIAFNVIQELTTRFISPNPEHLKNYSKFLDYISLFPDYEKYYILCSMTEAYLYIFDELSK